HLKTMNRLFLLLTCLIVVFLESAAQTEINQQHKPVFFQIGYGGIDEVGYGGGSRTHGAGNYMVKAVYAYQFSSDLFLGAGMGLRSYDPHPLYDFPLLIRPVFANLRVNFNKKKISPLLSAYVGRSFDWQHGLKDAGMVLGGNIGMRFAIFAKTALQFGIGQEMQRS